MPARFVLILKLPILSSPLQNVFPPALPVVVHNKVIPRSLRAMKPAVRAYKASINLAISYSAQNVLLHNTHQVLLRRDIKHAPFLVNLIFSIIGHPQESIMRAKLCRSG